MPMNPRQAERLALATRDLYVAAEADVTALLAKRLEQGIDQPQWAQYKLAELQRLRRDIEGIIAKLQSGSDQAVAEAIQSAYLSGSNAAVADIKSIGQQGEIVTTFGLTNQHAIRRIVGEASANLKSTHFRILRQSLDVYRRAVAQASQFTVLGTTTRQQAAQAVLNQFANNGVTGFVDKAGRNWQLDTYAEMATRTATGRAAVQGHLDRFTANEYDLVIVSNHGGACPLCAPWEGTILSIAGKTAGYPTVDEAHAAGFQHPNCRHTVGLFVPGLTRTPDVQADDKREAEYEDSQTQRYYERQIRKWKRRELAAITDEERRKARSKVRAWQQTTKAFVEAKGRKRLSYREQVRTGKASPPPPIRPTTPPSPPPAPPASRPSEPPRTPPPASPPPGLARALKDEEKASRLLPRERATIFDADGNVIFAKTGGESSVPFDDHEIELARGHILTHNHPNGRKYPKSDPRHQGNSFSSADLHFSCLASLTEMRAVTPVWDYSIKPPAGGWNLAYWRNTLEPTFRKHEAEVRLEFGRKILSKELSIPKAEANHWHEIWKRVSKELGLNYTRKKAP